MGRLETSLSDYNDTLSKTPVEIHGALGTPIGGKRLVEVPGRNAFVYVRLRNTQNELIQAFNNQVAPVYDLPVIVIREGNRYIVQKVDSQRYANNWTSFAPYLPRHGNTHSFDTENGGGGDIVWVQSRQFMPMLSIPSGSDGAPDVVLAPYILRDLNSSWKYVGNTGTVNLTQYNPTGSYGVMVLVYIDSVSGNPGIIVNSGSYFPATITGTAQIVPYLPVINNPAWIPDSAVRLVSGTLVVGWDNIYDVRQFIGPTVTGSAGGGGSITVQDEGVSQGSATTFNFVGGRILASVAGATATIRVSPDPQELIGIMGWFEGMPLGTGTVLDVGGINILMTISGSVLRLESSAISSIDIGNENDSFLTSGKAIYFTGSAIRRVTNATIGGDSVGVVEISAPAPGVDQIGVYVQDEGVPLGTGTVLNFVGPNVDASISGSVVRVFITGSPVTGIPSGTVQVFNTGTFVGSADKFDFQYPLAVGFTGTKAYPYLQGSLLAWEDVSAQIISGSNVTHFNLTGTVSLGTDRLYYNGLRQQRLTHYTIDSNGKGFTTLFTGTYGDVMILEYGNLGAQAPISSLLNVYDDSVSKGAVGGVSFDTGLSVNVDGNNIAHISGSSVGDGAMFVIDDQVLASPTGSFVFAVIPQTYTHLLIKASLRGVSGSISAGNMAVQFNGDTNAADYSMVGLNLYPSGSFSLALDAYLSASSNRLGGVIPGRSNTARYFAASEMEILDYRCQSKYKVIHHKGANFNDITPLNGSALWDRAVWWENTGTITSMRIVCDDSSNSIFFAADSRITLYGLK